MYLVTIDIVAGNDGSPEPDHVFGGGRRGLFAAEGELQQRRSDQRGRDGHEDDDAVDASAITPY